MKKLLLLLLFIPLISFGQDSTTSRLGNKWIYDNTLYYEVIYNNDLEVQDGYIDIKITRTAYVTSFLVGASIKVQKKEGKTRILVYDFKMGVENVGIGSLIGGVGFGASTEQTYNFTDQVYNTKKMKWDRFVRAKRSERVEKGILEAITNKAGISEKILDW